MYDTAWTEKTKWLNNKKKKIGVSLDTDSFENSCKKNIRNITFYKDFLWPNTLQNPGHQVMCNTILLCKYISCFFSWLGFQWY
jgi:hypothetical protein